LVLGDHDVARDVVNVLPGSRHRPVFEADLDRVVGGVMVGPIV
jgi:hypothetical protein